MVSPLPSFTSSEPVLMCHPALFFLANNQLLKVFHHPHSLTVLNEILGVVTVVVWIAVLLLGIFAVVTGRLFRD